MKVREARLVEHKEVLNLAKQSKYTRDFGHMMFSSESAYEKGWIVVAEAVDETEWAKLKSRYMGFYCVRHKVRSKETTLYFITVDEGAKRLGVATALLWHIKATSPHKRLVLNVNKKNIDAVRFYEHHGFKFEGDSLRGEGHSMSLEW